jgi:hypothetical protein
VPCSAPLRKEGTLTLLREEEDGIGLQKEIIREFYDTIDGFEAN